MRGSQVSRRWLVTLLDGNAPFVGADPATMIGGFKVVMSASASAASTAPLRDAGASVRRSMPLTLSQASGSRKQTGPTNKPKRRRSTEPDAPGEMGGRGDTRGEAMENYGSTGSTVDSSLARAHSAPTLAQLEQQHAQLLAELQQLQQRKQEKQRQEQEQKLLLLLQEQQQQEQQQQQQRVAA